MEILALFVNAVAMAVIAWQSFEVRRQATGTWAQVQAIERQTAADHERRKKQATIEYYSQLRISRVQLQTEVEAQFGRETVRESEISGIMHRAEEGDPEAEAIVRLLRDYLAGLERLATGVNMEVFDYEIVRRLGGGHIVTVFRRYEAYIRASRRSTQQPTLYCELERLADHLRADKSIDDRGKIT